MARVSVEREQEGDRGWTFSVAVTRNDGARSVHLLDLSWADYDHWSRGAAPPERVAHAVMTRLLEHEGATRTPERLDASTVRRRLPDADALIRGALGGE